MDSESESEVKDPLRLILSGRIVFQVGCGTGPRGRGRGTFLLFTGLEGRGEEGGDEEPVD